MCDYSLHAVASRPAEVAETLVSTKFRSTTTRGFTNPDNPMVAVCLRPGAEIAFETDVRTGGCLGVEALRRMFASRVPHTLPVFAELMAALRLSTLKRN